MNKDNKIVIILSKKKVLTGIIIALIVIFLITMIVLIGKSKNSDNNEKNSTKVVEKKETKKEEKKETTKKDTDKKDTDTKKDDKKDDQKDDKKKEEEVIDPNAPKFPDLTGLTLEEATDKLNKAHIASDFTIQREDSELKKGVVVRTEPKAGTPLPEGKLQIVFYLSNGSKKFVLEDYEGKDFDETKKILEARGIVVKVEFKKPNYERDNVPQNMIIGQSVAAGKELKAGDSITLYLAKGSVKYPDFTNGHYVLKDVQEFCDMYGVKLTVLYDEVTTYEDGLVFYQDTCMPGDEVEAGCEMTIKIAQH